MKVVLDGRALQARMHFRDGIRLASFVAAVAGDGAEVSFAFDGLARIDGDVVVVATRSPAHVLDLEPSGYADEELDTLERHVRGGGGLLLLTNHGDVPGKAPDHTREDARLARRFGIEIERTCFVGETPPAAMPARPYAHPVTRAVRRVATMTTASITGGIPLIPIAEAMFERSGRATPAGRSFAVAAECGGRVVVVGNSGFLATPGTTVPNQGLFATGDNAVFVRNAIRWLGGENDE